MEKKYYSFIEYCNDMELTELKPNDYWDYVAYCEMNNFEYDEFEEDVLSVWDDYLDDDYNDDYDDYYDDSKSLCRGCPFIGDCRTCYED